MRQFATDLFKNGKEGDVLKKNSDASMDFGFGEGGGGLPEGGNAGDYLVSDGEGGAEWEAPILPEGGNEGDYLVSDGEGGLEWQAPAAESGPELKVINDPDEQTTNLASVDKIASLYTSAGVKSELSYYYDDDSSKYIIKLKVTNETGSSYPLTISGVDIKCRSVLNNGRQNITGVAAASGSQYLTVSGVLEDAVSLDTYIPFSFSTFPTSIPAGEYVEESIEISVLTYFNLTVDTEHFYTVTPIQLT